MKPYTDIEQSRLNTKTQEEKAYDKALSIAKNIYGASECEDILCTLETIFPELKESEDEKIRKVLLNDFKNNCSEYYCEGVNRDMIIAWLEKQGEQNPTDKVEPKFKVGDWVVQENIGVYKVIEVCESWYEVIDGEDNHYSISFDKEYMCHLWTIQDAKDGDVLVTPNQSIFIFKEIKGATVYDYCGLYFNKFCDESLSVNGTIATKLPKDYAPATKEQRDQLEKAMADADFTFDFNKKELKKIEHSPAWSEEDEKIRQGIWVGILANKHNAKECEWKTYDKFLDWLKSLKDRVQPQIIADDNQCK